MVADAIKIGGYFLLKKTRLLISLFNITIPDKWDNILVILVHKRGNTAILENYRPIGLLRHFTNYWKTD